MPAIRRTCTGILLSLLTGCAAPSPSSDVKKDEEEKKQEIILGDTLAIQLEKEIRILKAPDVGVFLRGMALKIAAQSDELKGRPVGVQMVAPRAGLWQSFSLPGGRVYLSGALLAQMDFDNEIAGVLAFQLAHLHGRDVQERIADAQLSRPENAGVELKYAFFGPVGILSFSASQHVEAAARAVRLMYGAGYDPRGLFKLWKILKQNPKKSPVGEELLPQLEERTRDEIASLSPLRNPIVKSEEFQRVEKKLRKF